MDLALLVLRLIVGLLFVGHGAQKLFGAFGGAGINGTAATFEKIGLGPARVHAIAAGCAELGGGLLLALGLLTPLAAATITAVMVTAIITVHARNGLWNTEKGFEYNLVLIAAAFAIVGAGPGAWSLGQRSRSRPQWRRVGARRARRRPARLDRHGADRAGLGTWPA